MIDNNLFYNKMQEIFKEEYDDFIKALNSDLKPSFFLNSLKSTNDDILSLIDFKISQSQYNENSYYFDEDISIGKTILYDLGLIYPQEVSASIPAKILNPKENSIIVDMCAAPGGKTINMANISNDNSLIIANEYEYKRALVLSSNIERIGISNIIITNKNGNDLADNLYNLADYVLLDAPCSGEGMARKHKSVIDEYSQANVNLCVKRQEELIENAYDILKPGGYLVYSTCTYEILENESIINNFLKRHDDIELIDIDHAYQRRGIDNDKMIRLTILDGTEGQFVAYLHKLDNNQDKRVLKYKKTVKNKVVEDFINKELALDDYYLYEHNGYYYISLIPLIDLGKNVLRYGICCGEVKKNIFYPSHSLYRSTKLKKYFKHIIELNDEEYLKYRSGLSIFKDYPSGYYLLTYKGFNFGYTKLVNKELKNKYPKGLRF